IELEHDFVAYAKDVRTKQVKLADYGPGKLTITDPLKLRWFPIFGWARLPFDGRMSFFELNSELIQEVSQPKYVFFPDKLTQKEIGHSAMRFARAATDHVRRIEDSRRNLGLSRSSIGFMAKKKATGTR